MLDKEDKIGTILAREGDVFNYLTVATRQASSVIKISGWAHDDIFKEE